MVQKLLLMSQYSVAPFPKVIEFVTGQTGPPPKKDHVPQPPLQLSGAMCFRSGQWDTSRSVKNWHPGSLLNRQLVVFSLSPLSCSLKS